MNGLSLFGNIGIAELGFDMTNINIIAYSELDPQRVELYRHQFPDNKIIEGDINSKKKEIINYSIENNIEFIIATPPCQGSSIAGRRKANDPRNLLIVPTIEVIKKVKPRYALIENVSIYFRDKINVNGSETTIKQFILDKLSKEYHVEVLSIDAADYGVPQHRRRGFVLITRKGEDKWTRPAESSRVSVRDLIGELPSLVPECHDEPEFTKRRDSKIKHHKTTAHARRHIEIMMHTPEGKSAFDNEIFYPKRKDGVRVRGFRTTYKRMSWDKPAPTITMANKSISSQNNVHPGKKRGKLYSDPRPLSLFELMLLMTIPVDWKLTKHSTEDRIRKYIGEGIPPLLIYQFVKGLK